MIRLSERSPLGTGRHRKCYTHLKNAQHCIGIVYHHGDGGDKGIRRELEHYVHLGRRLEDQSGTPRYHGTIEADYGTDYVYDVTTGFDGKPSITLIEFVEQRRYEEDITQLRQLLKQLKRHLQDNHIVTMSLKPQNILRHRINESKVTPVVYDNIGESISTPLATWSEWCCPRKQGRLWKRFITQSALVTALQKDPQPRESKTLALISREVQSNWCCCTNGSPPS